MYTVHVCDNITPLTIALRKDCASYKYLQLHVSLPGKPGGDIVTNMNYTFEMDHMGSDATDEDAEDLLRILRTLLPSDNVTYEACDDCNIPDEIWDRAMTILTEG